MGAVACYNTMKIEPQRREKTGAEEGPEKSAEEYLRAATPDNKP